LEYSRVKATLVSMRLQIFLFAFKIPNSYNDCILYHDKYAKLD
jgi:hypothetical protein